VTGKFPEISAGKFAEIYFLIYLECSGKLIKFPAIRYADPNISDSYLLFSMLQKGQDGYYYCRGYLLNSGCLHCTGSVHLFLLIRGNLRVFRWSFHKFP